MTWGTTSSNHYPGRWSGYPRRNVLTGMWVGLVCANTSFPKFYAYFQTNEPTNWWEVVKLEVIEPHKIGDTVCVEISYLLLQTINNRTFLFLNYKMLVVGTWLKTWELHKIYYFIHFILYHIIMVVLLYYNFYN